MIIMLINKRKKEKLFSIAKHLVVDIFSSHKRNANKNFVVSVE